MCDQGCLAAPSSICLYVTSNFRALVDYLFRSWQQSIQVLSPCPALLGPSLAVAHSHWGAFPGLQAAHLLWHCFGHSSLLDVWILPELCVTQTGMTQLPERSWDHHGHGNVGQHSLKREKEGERFCPSLQLPSAQEDTTH